jgi:type III restriction enzyme
MTTQTFQLESLAYQNQAMCSVVEVFSGTPKSQPQDGPGNRCPLTWEQLKTNIQQIALRQRISDEWLQLSAPGQGQPIDLCVEMETGTGKTLVYLRTLYRLHTAYGWNKFIIVVPSVAIRRSNGNIGECQRRNGSFDGLPSSAAHPSSDSNKFVEVATRQNPPR